jgi:hypothetical protein
VLLESSIICLESSIMRLESSIILLESSNYAHVEHLQYWLHLHSSLNADIYYHKTFMVQATRVLMFTQQGQMRGKRKNTIRIIAFFFFIFNIL